MSQSGKPFKTHNALGKPLCPACGSNPRKLGRLKCGRCQRENRPIQWDMILQKILIAAAERRELIREQTVEEKM
jgi:tRNA(Ile2) C34 agmatinyltransferase TiaS